MVWINKDTGVVLSKDGHTLFVDLVAEDEERERLAERSGLADPHGDMPDKEYLEAAVIIHDNGHAHGECYATDRHTGMVRFGRFELTDMELNQLGRELPFLADREDPRRGRRGWAVSSAEAPTSATRNDMWAEDGTRRIRTSAPESPTIWMPPSPNTGKADTPPTKAE